MKTTRYFEEQVLRKRPYIEREWCAAAIAAPIQSETQTDGRIPLLGRSHFTGRRRAACAKGGDTVHNAFLDRDFRKEPR